MQIFLLVLIPVLFPQNKWIDYTDLNGRFKISTPGNFEEKIDTVETEIGQLIYHTLFYQNDIDRTNNDVYMVSYCDYPEEIIFADSTDLAGEFFQSTMESAAESVEGEILYSTDINLDNHPGKFWRIDYMEGAGVIKTKAYLVKNRYYAVQVITFDNKKENTFADRFFDSFSIF
ncbi:MAG: hypothetical protein R2788_25975 [Saprospiraceae bacterium]